MPVTPNPLKQSRSNLTSSFRHLFSTGICLSYLASMLIAYPFMSLSAKSWCFLLFVARITTTQNTHESTRSIFLMLESERMHSKLSLRPSHLAQSVLLFAASTVSAPVSRVFTAGCGDLDAVSISSSSYRQTSLSISTVNICVAVCCLVNFRWFPLSNEELRMPTSNKVKLLKMLFRRKQATNTSSLWNINVATKPRSRIVAIALMAPHETQLQSLTE